jgi:hypothetical protein
LIVEVKPNRKAPAVSTATWHVSKASALFKQTLSPEALDRLARETRFVRRERLVTASSIVWAFMLTLGAHPLRYISDVLRTMNSRESWSLRYKPLWNRLATASFARFMKALFEKLCRELTTEMLRRTSRGDAWFFSAIFADDGSSFAVADGLEKVFPGRFTKIKPAAVELHAHMDVLRDSLVSVTLAADKEAERQFLPDAHSLPKRSLSLRDRGYIDRAYFEALDGRDTYLICRARSDLNPTIAQVRGVPRRIAKQWSGRKLQQLRKSKLKRDLDLTVSWPRPDGGVFELRLVIRYVPEKKSWTWLLTNLPHEKFDADTVGRLYRLRWQIELVFKDWKSNANLHALQSEQPAIVEGFIWASLCAALIKRALAHWAQLVAGTKRISTRIAASAGPQIMPRLADWAARRFPIRLFDELLRFLAHNALRTHPERDRRAPSFALGLRPAAVA